MAENPATEREPTVGGFVHPLQVLNENLPPGPAPAATVLVRPRVRRIGLADLREALARGWQDFSAHRTDVMFLCLLYPVLGLVLFRAAIGYEVLALLFPLAAGFALIGPLAGTGLYEMSRRMEAGEEVSWRTPFAVLRARGFGPILVLGLLFAALFVIWLQTALAIYQIFLGPEVPPSFGAFLAQVFTTRAGWYMIVEGNLVGLLFAIVALCVGVVSFPMLIDGRFGRTGGEMLSLAVATSLRAVFANPVPMAAWGLIVAACLIVGSVPFFLGLVVAVPVLGHATWHLYRRVVAS
jgi:uncharacterized membrane protein